MSRPILLTALGLVTTTIGFGAHADDPPPTLLRFANTLPASGIDFEHYGERHRWCEIGPQVKGVATNEEIPPALFELPLEFANRHLIRMNGSGAAWLDFDGDGDWDLYLVNGASGEETTNALYRNDGQGRFTSQTRDCGALDAGEGMAVSVADYDNDGDPDLFVTNFGSFVLLRNEGGERFTDVTTSAFPGGVPDRWYGGSAWGDIDGDGDLDLYVCGYVDLTRTRGNPSLRFPMDFAGSENTLYRNEGGTFIDMTDAAHVSDGRRKSMQVLIADFNDDNRPDLLVANDTDPNGLYLNRGDGTFKEFSGPSGVSSTDGSMGIAYGDYNADGLMDLYVSNYTGEADLMLTMVDNTSSNDGALRNAIFEADFASPNVLRQTWGKVGWGTGLFDLDNDADLDLFVANGHLNAVSGDNRDANLLFENTGDGRFRDVSAASGILTPGPRIHRSAIFADYDDDGRLDVYVVNNGEEAYRADSDRTGVLLHNEGAAGQHFVKIRLQGTTSNRDALGAKVRVTAGGKTQQREHVSGVGYFSANAYEIHVGLGAAETIDRLEVRWPSGRVETHTGLAVDRTYRFVEGG
ncbi:MAG: CRTAC1 family protein [Phycisphaerales bacterium]|nr:CRTAC1 family protein [Phycisphaerales bacterium]